MPSTSDDLLFAIDHAQAAGRLSVSAKANIRRWLSEPQYSSFLPSLVEHITAGRWAELDDVFWTVTPFGTAGRRGRMYPIGSNAINDRTIGESTQGLANYVRKLPVASSRKLLCAVSYDTRHHSRHFAELCAEVMVASGFDVLFFDGFRPTPELSFTVRDQHCDCGIMISASHNPPTDNAIKVFWSTGGQLRPPHDARVIECVAQVTEIERANFSEEVVHGRIRFCQDAMDTGYQNAVLAQSEIGPRELRILYSPLHGVGLTSVLPVLKADGFEHVNVYEKHAAADGDFPNVPNHIANPENVAVFDALIEDAHASGSELVLASDPDADRIGCAAPLAYSHASDGEPVKSPWQTLTGNQIGVLLGELLLRRLKESGQLTSEHYVVKTLVTSDMICRVADQFGVRAYGDVLTGFKWIGSLIDEIGPDKFVFGFEEAHGYLAGTYARDKDGAVAAMLLAELAAECKSAGRTLHQQLDLLFLQYGCHLEKTIGRTLPGADGVTKMAAMMERLRISPPRTLGGLPVLKVRDYLLQSIHMLNSGKHEPMRSNVPPSDLLIFDLEMVGNRAAVRPSGTEPKIKFYLFAAQQPPSAAEEGLRELGHTKEMLKQRLLNIEVDLMAAAD